MVLLLPACGSKDATDAATGGSGRGSGVAGTQAGDDSVAAVIQSVGTPVATLRYSLPERPVAGRPFQVRLSASAPQPVPGLQLTVESTELEFSPERFGLALEQEDSAADQDLTVIAREQGLVDLVVRLTADGVRGETVYAVPLMVTAGP
jgi:hypothetical protein